MKNIDIKLENCFGIGKFDYSFKFGELDTNSFLVYAPNGTMKTSFALTLDKISKNEKNNLPCDRVYEDRKSHFEITVDGNDILPESILVVNAEDNNYDATNKISSFVASKELKKKYDEIYSDLDSKKNEYIKKLKEVSKSTDCETEFVETFKNTPKDTFFEILLIKNASILSNPVPFDFRYNDIFDKKGNVKKFLEKNQKLLTQYINNYNELLNQSNFFKRSENSFGTYQANELIKSIEDNAYFDAGHQLNLKDKTEIKSASELKELLQNELTNILKDEKLKKAFDQIDKAIGSNTELRAFKNVIEKDNSILIELEDYEKFREKIWLNYISRLNEETKELSMFYASKKNEIESIIKEAKKEFPIWEQIIKTFNERFYVPFYTKLENQDDVILKEKTAHLEFEYRDTNEAPVIKEKDHLLPILSKGEQRAFYLLQLLFDVESRKQAGNYTLLVLDDIADSFDYKNKYAIIEYIKELHLNSNSNFRLIILTHNFDFYRTVANRIDLKRVATLMALKNESREIKLEKGQYLKDIFSFFKENISKEKFFISIIPLVRNITEYINGMENEAYERLTCCLHLKDDTKLITCGEILEFIHSCFPITKKQNISFGKKPIKDLIYETADLIEKEEQINEILLENKIVLSIAIRLRAEEYMLNNIPDSINLKITSKQTTELLAEFKKSNTDKETITILERVNLMTPENIHLNAFMYEPLIDISVFHLIDLYKTIKQLK